MARLLEITYTRSAIGRLPNQRKTIEALGLRKLHDRVRHEDNPTIRGMINTVGHLVTFREIEQGDSA
jgi:large subunit ribosomal protein L30